MKEIYIFGQPFSTDFKGLIKKQTQLLTRKVLHGLPRGLRPPSLKLFRIQSSYGKIGKQIYQAER